jgi:flagellar biosynthesis protein FlhB
MAEDLGERTEDPTPKRLEEARRDGNIARSQELSSALMLLAGTVVAAVALMPLLRQFRSLLEASLAGDTLGSPIVAADTRAFIEYVATAAARMTLPLLLVIAAAAYLAHVWQIGLLFAPKALAPQLSKLNPMQGLGRLFGLTNLFKAGLSVVKTALILVLVAVTIFQYRREILLLAYLEPMQALGKGGLMLLDLAFRLIAVLLLLGVLDYLYQKWKHKEDLKMTRQQVKDEMKQAEGDPHVKRRRARMAQTIAMQRINASVPKADVVVTNPEHVSVAITYDAGQMNAPTVVAKGADFLALRIRQIALMHEIPIVERPPLARALYRQVAVGQEIPPAYYHAVAEILAYVYQLNGRRAG